MGIKEIRESKGMTQQELAEKAGIAVRTIARYEKGERKPDEEKAALIASCLGVEVSQFSEEPKQEELQEVEKLEEPQEGKKMEEICKDETGKKEQVLLCPFRCFTKKQSDGYSAQRFSECLYERCAMYSAGGCKMNPGMMEK